MILILKIEKDFKASYYSHLTFRVRLYKIVLSSYKNGLTLATVSPFFEQRKNYDRTESLYQTLRP
jgi:hypothetical protein